MGKEEHRLLIVQVGLTQDDDANGDDPTFTVNVTVPMV